MNYCIDCLEKGIKIEIDCRAIRCKICASQGIRNGNYKDGRCSKVYYCKEEECNNEIHYTTWKYRKGRCQSCANKDENNPFFDKYHTKKNKIKISESRKGKYKGKNSPRFGKISHGKGDYYKGIWMRSSWEIKFAFFLDCSKIKWYYETKAFDLSNTSYTPDFYIPEWNCYIEIKGYWRKDAEKKFKEFKKKFSIINIKVLMEKDLKERGIL